jgi:hypothetical protein
MDKNIEHLPSSKFTLIKMIRFVLVPLLPMLAFNNCNAPSVVPSLSSTESSSNSESVHDPDAPIPRDIVVHYPTLEHLPWGQMNLAGGDRTFFPLQLIYPRNSESSSWAYNKNAYPGMAWQIPISARGGVWPYRFQITNNGGISSLSIGEYLTPRLDAVTGLTIYEKNEEYGVLHWGNPIAGNYSITVEITDQEGTKISVPIDLQVGTAGWVFIDNDVGSDSNPGTFAAPFKSMAPLHNGTSAVSPYARHRVVLKGTTPIQFKGMPENKNNYRTESNNVPAIFVGYPGAQRPILETNEGWFVVTNTNDFYFAGITFRYGINFNPGGDPNLGPFKCNKDPDVGPVDVNGRPIYMFVILDQQSRLTWFDNHFQDFKGYPCGTGMDNSAIMFFTDPTGVSYPWARAHHYVAVIRNEAGGGQTRTTGTLVQAYRLMNSIVEQNVYRDALFDTYTASTHSAIYLKDSPYEVTVRANDFIDSLDWRPSGSRSYSMIAIGGQSGAARVEICFNKINTRDNSLQWAPGVGAWTNGNSDGPFDNIVWYRNSIYGSVNRLGSKYPAFVDESEYWVDNLFVGDQNNLIGPDMSSPLRPIFDQHVVEYNNRFGTGLFGADMNLTNAAKPAHLSQAGAEIAE